MPRRSDRRSSDLTAARRWLIRAALIVVGLLAVEYLVVPQVVGAGKTADLLKGLSPWWLVGAVGLEAASLLCYALLTRDVLPGHRPSLERLVRIMLSSAALAHLIPGGAAGGTGLGYRLLTASGVPGPEAGFTLVTQSAGSALVLNAMLWLTLLVSIPTAGVHPVYVVIALIGVVALLASGGVVYLLTRGEEHALRAVRALGTRLPLIGAGRLEALVDQLAASVTHLARDRQLLRRAALWAALNWLLDAASLWTVLAALGSFVNPVDLFAAYGIANVLGALPLTPGGLGVIEASAGTLIVAFGVPRAVATLGVIGWRLVNFWLPVPVGAIAWLSLRLQGHTASSDARTSPSRANDRPAALGR